MDPSRDNPILRFTTFWWALGTFFIFALLLAVIWLFNRSDVASLEEPRAQERYAIRTKIDAAQAANLSPEAISAANTGAQLSGNSRGESQSAFALLAMPGSCTVSRA